MNITFEGRELSFNNVTLSWYVESPVNEYRVSVDFIGGFDDDEDDEILESSIYADITIYEVKHNDLFLMDRIYNQALNRGLDVTRNCDTVMVNAPEIRENITCRN